MTRMLDLLGDQEPILVLEATPVKLEAILLQIGDNIDFPYAPGKWDTRRITAHLADNELAAGFRLRQTVARVGEV